ncbi:hypothetical protein ALC53_13499 [Atta colombica]|uniref:Uncharacterized protein n=1 Tax=Atta colombica TaxID=520822 RepID=A0A195AVL2_9HYME|nr:hypothetical protein ALC53_13499 [Atta colombica]
MRGLFGSPKIAEPPKRAINGPKDGLCFESQFPPAGERSLKKKTWEADLTASLIQDEKDRMAEQFQITVPDLLLQACREFSRMEDRRSFRTARLRSASGRYRFRPVCQRPATRRPHAR